MDSNDLHLHITKKLNEIKELADLHQKNLRDEMEKAEKKITTLETAATNQKLDYRSVLNLAEYLKGQNEELNAKNMQLQNQVKNQESMKLEIQKLKEKLDSKNHVEDEFLKLVSDLSTDLRQKERSLQALDESYTYLIVQERQINEEFQKARKKLIKGLEETEAGRYDDIVVKRMGELDTRPFLKAMSSKRDIRKSELAQRASELCSLWESYLEDPHSYPFKIRTIAGKTQEIIDDEDERLKDLRRKVSVEAYKAVVVALKELNECNPSGRTVVPEMWHKRLERKATLEEGVEFLLNQRKNKRKKSTTNEVVNDVNLKG